MADLSVDPSSAHLPVSSNVTETTPLLSNARNHSRVTEDDEARLSTLVWQEARTLSWFALPVFGIHILEYSFTFAPVIFVGHISTTALAATSLASMTAGVTGYSVIHGFTSALDTLMPSAWTSDKPQLVGLWAQRMSVAVTVILLPVALTWLHAEPILLGLKQDPEVASLAALYLRVSIFGLPAYAFNCISRRYFMAQGLFKIPTQIITIVAPLNLLLNYLLVWGPPSVRLGFIGSPIAAVISYNLVSLMSIICGVCFVPRTAWHPLTTRCFKSLGVVYQLGLADVAQTATEWWAWEIAGFFASFLGPTFLAAQSVVMTSGATTFQGPYALGVATSIRIGNLLGAKSPRRAHITANLSVIIVLCVSLIFSIVLVVCRNSWSYIFNDDPEVARLVAQILPFLAFFQLLDGNATVAGGILRAQGKQFLGAALNAASYYVIGLPLAALFMFKLNMGLTGLWTALPIGLTFGSLSSTFLVLRSKWDHEVFKAQERIRKEGTGKVPVPSDIA